MPNSRKITRKSLHALLPHARINFKHQQLTSKTMTNYKKLGFVGFVDEDGDMIWHKNLGNGIYVYFGARAKGTAGACREISFGPWEGEANTSNPIKGVSAIRVLRTVKQWLDTTSVKCYAEAGDARLARFYAKLGWTGFFQINY